MTATLIALSFFLGAHQDAPKPTFFDGTGSHTRKVSTSSELAQRWFDQGLAFMFAFNHDEAVRSFEEATRVDPNCAMAYWGIATALGPNINNPTVEPDAATKAYTAIHKADAILKGKSGVERDLVSAQMTRYSKDPSAARAPLDKAYAQAMRGVWAKHKTDPDIGALTAESLMDLHPWDLWTHEGAPKPWTPEIRQILNDALKLDKKHPLALHLTIHSTESSAHPEDGLYAAHTIADLEPGMGHMVHMPSHTYVRTGDWDAAITTNEKAITADEAYFAKRPEQGFYLIYMAHNHQMLAYAAMMVGRSKDGIDGIDALVNMIPMELQEAYAPMMDGYLAAIYEARIRFGKWDDILAMPERNEKFPVMRTMRHMARAVSWAVKHEDKKARMEQAMFYESLKHIPDGYMIGNNTAPAIIAIAKHMMNGEILLGEMKLDASASELRLAVKAEDASMYNEPPDWLQPTRHALGAVLVMAGHYAEAEKVYREDLRRLPHNGWSTYGLAQALAGQKKDTSNIDADFKKIWADADIPIDSSCMCVPGK